MKMDLEEFTHIYEEARGGQVTGVRVVTPNQVLGIRSLSQGETRIEHMNLKGLGALFGPRHHRERGILVTGISHSLEPGLVITYKTLGEYTALSHTLAAVTGLGLFYLIINLMA